ncbi:hypothetical protein Adt_41778 [Abeliophyllum distichum]|uniref:NADH dehydrogenase [ubiquinone] 1 alpha subcomplex subunit 12 n=1 Tax=Abeliophyllum distichum TaxID=126358 RepID=A0ABD1PPT8_9LAMI
MRGARLGSVRFVTERFSPARSGPLIYVRCGAWMRFGSRTKSERKKKEGWALFLMSQVARWIGLAAKALEKEKERALLQMSQVPSEIGLAAEAPKKKKKEWDLFPNSQVPSGIGLAAEAPEKEKRRDFAAEEPSPKWDRLGSRSI